VIRGVNELICESLANGGRAEPVAFFCECSDPGCYQPVWLTPAQFMLARNDPEWAALTDGHSAARLHET
jgi:hypothetical protein